MNDKFGQQNTKQLSLPWMLGPGHRVQGRWNGPKPALPMLRLDQVK
jgi:hypothetical protein